jgi:hypothetical protein
MMRPIKFLSGPARLGALAIVAASGLAIPHAQAQFCCSGPPPNDVSDFAFLYTGDPHTLNFTNSTVTGNIGIGDTGVFRGFRHGTVNGTVQFSAANVGQFQPNGVTVTGGATFGNANVQTNLNALNTLSQSLRNEGGAPELIAAGGSVNASSGILDSNGNEVFTATIYPNFTAGTTFTINGTSSQFVVFNTQTGGLPFDGSVVLTGGITSDHVLFTFDAGNFDTLSGGDPLTINTAGNPTTGTYLDPNGPFQITDTVLNGRVFGGDTADSGITNSTVVAPPPFQAPEPTSLALLGAGLVAFGIIRRRPTPTDRGRAPDIGVGNPRDELNTPAMSAGAGLARRVLAGSPSS